MPQYTLADAQEIFNIAYLGLASQGFKQSLSSGKATCAYRGKGGLKCAIGHVIKDDALAIALDAPMDYPPQQKSGYSISCLLTGSHPLDRKVQEIFDSSPEFIDFLSALQGVHDYVYALGDAINMEKGLKAFAKRHNLTIPTVPPIPTIPPIPTSNNKQEEKEPQE
jgi:hypothetical protein